MTLIEEVIECIRVAAYVQGAISPDALLTDIAGVDSLTVLEIRLRAEAEFQVELDDADMERATTARKLAEIIKEKRAR